MDCSILFTTFQTRRVWIRLGLTDLAIMRNAMDNWDPVSASVSGTHMSNQVSSSTNLLLQSRYEEDLGGKQSLSVSVFFLRGPSWKQRKRAGCSPASSSANWQHTRIEVHIWECSNARMITQPASPVYVNRKAKTPVSYTEVCPWVLPIYINNMLQSIDFSNQEFKGIWIICLLVRNKKTEAKNKLKKILYFIYFSITLVSKRIFWKINF